MTSFVSVATLILVTVNQLLTPCNCAQRVEKCDDNVWDISLSHSTEEGEADLIITVPFDGKGPFASSVLACLGLAVNGTGKETIDTHKAGRPVVAHHISIPEAQDLAEYISQDGWQNYSCILQLSPAPGQGEGLECEIRLRTVMGRILPKCSLQRGQSLLQAVEVKRDLAQVHLYLENSANDVFTQDSTCDTGNVVSHDHSRALEENMLPLAPPGVDSPVVDIDFFPDCDNDTLRALYTEQRMSDCHMELYLVCQEGLQLVRKMALDFDDAAMTCDPPKQAYDRLLEHFQLTFYIESRPVVALLLLLLANMLPYLLLLPALVIKVVTARGRGQPWAPPKRHQEGNDSEKMPLLPSHCHSPTLPQSPSHITKNTVFSSPITSSAVVTTSPPPASPITHPPAHSLTSLPSPPPSSSHISPSHPHPPILTETITLSPPPSTSHIPPPPPPPVHTETVTSSPPPSTSHIPPPSPPPPIYTETITPSPPPSTSHIPPPPPPPPPPIHTETITHSPPPSTSHIPPPPPPPPVHTETVTPSPSPSTSHIPPPPPPPPVHTETVTPSPPPSTSHIPPPPPPPPVHTETVTPSPPPSTSHIPPPPPPPPPPPIH